MIDEQAEPKAQSSVARDIGWGPWAPYVAEVIGTFGLVFAGCGAIMVDRLSGGQVTHVGVGLVFGLIITVMIYALGHIIAQVSLGEVCYMVHTCVHSFLVIAL